MEKIRLRVKTRNPLWAYRKAYAKHIIIPEYNVYEGDLKKVKKDWRFPKGEFMLVTGNPECPAHIINIDDVVEAWVKR